MTYNMMNNRSRQAPLCALFAALAASMAIIPVLSTTARATPLTVGSAIAAVGEPDPAGGYGIVADSGLIGFSAPGFFTGTLRSLVVAGDTNNPYGVNALTFLYQLANTGTPLQNSLERLTINGYVGFLTDASYSTVLPAGVLPASITRDTDVAGNVVGFNFQGAPFGFGKVTPGSTSAWLVVQTDATTYAASAAAVIDGSTVYPILTYAPTATIPEPATISLAALGTLTVALYARRRRR